MRASHGTRTAPLLAECGHTHRRLLALLLLIAALAAACAHGPHANVLPAAAPASAAASEAVSLFVMSPLLNEARMTGNSGFGVPEMQNEVTVRVLGAVQERFPGARIAQADRGPLMRGLPGYRRSMGDPSVITIEEFGAAIWAYEHGGTHLLVPSITEWKQMRTDDPIGAFILPHNRVSITLRLMRLKPLPATLVGRETFTNRARLTLNQSAAQLLDDRFRALVQRLVSMSLASSQPQSLAQPPLPLPLALPSPSPQT